MLVGIRHLQKYLPSDYTNHTLLILRVAAGIYLISSGILGGLLSIVDPMDFHDANFDAYVSIQIAAGMLLTTGLFTRLGSIMLLGVFASTFAVHGLEAMDQIMVLGIGLALIFKGGSKYSIDRIVFGERYFLKSLAQKLEVKRLFLPEIRIAFGVNLIWLGLIEKILVPDMFAAVMEKFHIAPVGVEPELAVFGAGLIELAIGLMYLLGIRMRIVSALMFGILIFTVVAFQESVLAHIIMFTVSVIFMINGKDSIIAISVDKVILLLRQTKNVLFLRMYSD